MKLLVFFGRVGAIMVLVAALVACAPATSAGVPPMPEVTAAPPTAVPPTAALPTVAPPTVVPPTAVPPTAAPVPPTMPVVESPGPGWVFALESDANFDGVADRIFYRPADSVPETTFDDPRLASVAVPVTDVALMQQSPSGALVLLTIDIHGGRADQPLFDFAGRREPSAYMLALDPAQGPLLNLLPYGAGGASYGGRIGIHWEAGESGFRVVGERPQ